MKCKNLNELFRQIETDIQETMTKEVVNEVKDELVNAVYISVYDAYSPVQYERRYDNGGLGSRQYMCMEETQNGFFVRDFAPLDNGRIDYHLDDIVVNGFDHMPFPRNFYQDCVETLETTRDHIEALKRGLKKRGYKVK